MNSLDNLETNDSIEKDEDITAVYQEVMLGYARYYLSECEKELRLLVGRQDEEAKKRLPEAVQVLLSAHQLLGIYEARKARHDYRYLK